MIRAIIFDCFGVLISDGLEIVCQQIEARDPEAREYIRETVAAANAGVIETAEYRQRVSDRLGVTLDEWNRLVTDGEVRNQDVFAMVRTARESYKTALLSNIGKGSLAKRFTDDELAEMFDVVVASAEVGMLKPDHAIYRYTADQLGVDPTECVFIDDREGYVDAAVQTGMRGIVFTSAANAADELRRILDSQEPATAT